MSRVGNRILTIPSGVTLENNQNLITIKGPKGELKKQFSTISESTIRRIMSGNYTSRISNKYQYVIDNLSWRLKSEDKKYKKN